MTILSTNLRRNVFSKEDILKSDLNEEEKSYLLDKYFPIIPETLTLPPNLEP